MGGSLEGLFRNSEQGVVQVFPQFHRGLTLKGGGQQAPGLGGQRSTLMGLNSALVWGCGGFSEVRPWTFLSRQGYPERIRVALTWAKRDREPHCP